MPQLAELEYISNNIKKSYVIFRGAGGTGKTTTFAKFILNNDISPDEYIFLGPTGKSVAVAEAKGVHGSTIHSFFNIQQYDNYAELNKFIELEYRTMHIYKESIIKKMQYCKYFFIDEISMINNHLLDHILKMITTCSPQYKLIILSGDFHQLEPVITNDVYKQNPTIDNSLGYIKKILRSDKSRLISFNTIYRSSNIEFNNFLSQLRTGKIRNVFKLIENLEKFCNIYNNIDPEIENKLTYLNFYNSEVKTINDRRLNALDGELTTSIAKTLRYEYPTGKKRVADLIIEDFQMDQELVFKPGAKILFRVNSIDGQFKNGEEAIVLSIEKDLVIVEKENGTRLRIGKHQYKSNILESENGFDIVIEQWPFSLGFARTIHKSQGDGFNYLNLSFSYLTNSNLSNLTKWKLLYVQLSRIINPKNVFIHSYSIQLLKSNYGMLKNIPYDELGLN